MNILQWNCNSLDDKKKEIQNLINLYDPLLFCLQNTKYKSSTGNSSMSFMKGYNLYNEDSQECCAGAGILFKNKKNQTTYDIRQVKFPPDDNIQMCVILIKSQENFDFYVASIYCSKPHVAMPLIISSLENVLKFFGSTPYLLMENYNTNNVPWDFINNNHLVVNINTEDASSNNTSLVLTNKSSPEMSKKITKWFVDDDHKAIVVNLLIPKPTILIIPPRHNKIKINNFWPKDKEMGKTLKEQLREQKRLRKKCLRSNQHLSTSELLSIKLKHKNIQKKNRQQIRQLKAIALKTGRIQFQSKPKDDVGEGSSVLTNKQTNKQRHNKKRHI